MIALFIRREGAVLDIFAIVLYGGADEGAGVGIAANEFGGGGEGEVEQIVEDEDLAVASGPAPMPMVGMGSSAVISAATSRGMPSRTRTPAPASARAWASALSWRTVSAVRAWTRYPPMRWRLCGVRPRWPMTGISASVSARTSSTRGPSILTASAPASLTKRMALRGLR